MSTHTYKTSQIVPADYQAGFCFAAPEADCPNGMNYALLRACKSGKPTTETIYAEYKGFLQAQGTRTIQPLKGFDKWADDRQTQCSVCGAHFKYGEVWKHIPTGECIVLGHECADKFGLLIDRSALEAYRKDAAQARKMGRRRLERKKALRTFAENADKGLLAALKCNHDITKSIRSNMIQWAGRSDRPLLSQKQEALVLKLHAQAQEPKAPEEVKVAAPVSDKRQTITGTIVSIKRSDGYYGTTTRMTVKVITEDGVWLCNGTLPSSIKNWQFGNDHYGTLRGCEIQFDAMMSEAPREKHFAFFKRPSKAKITKGGESQQKELDLINDVLTRDSADNIDTDHLAQLKGIKKTLEGIL